MRTVGLVVGGMDCRRCVREVTARLRDLPGVETVMADAGSSVVRLAGTVSVDDVLEALRGLCYSVELLGESDDAADTDHTGRQARDSERTAALIRLLTSADVG